jgi:hypothetical protein
MDLLLIAPKWCDFVHAILRAVGFKAEKCVMTWNMYGLFLSSGTIYG